MSRVTNNYLGSSFNSGSYDTKNIIVKQYTTPGSGYTFTVPEGVTRILVGVFGGGGNATKEHGGNGGAGVSAYIDVVPFVRLLVKMKYL